MKIKIVGSTTPKALALLLMKTMADLHIDEIYTATLYVNSGDECITVSAKGNTLPDRVTKPAKSVTHHCDYWEARPGIIKTQAIIDETDTSCPW